MGMDLFRQISKRVVFFLGLYSLTVNRQGDHSLRNALLEDLRITSFEAEPSSLAFYLLPQVPYSGTISNLVLITTASNLQAS